MDLSLKNNFAEFCNWFQPADFIAMIIIIGGFALKFKGADGVISFLLVSVAFYYFGKKNEILREYAKHFIN